MSDKHTSHRITPTEQAALVHALVYDIPELTEQLTDHVSREGRIKPGLFVNTVAARALASFRQGERRHNGDLLWRAIAGHLADYCHEHPDDGTVEFVRREFVDRLPQIGEPDDDIRFMLPDPLIADRRAMVDDYVSYLASHQDPDQKALIDRLVERVPALRPVAHEHVNENGVINPHGFFGDLTRWAAHDFDTHGTTQNGETPAWQVIVDILEDEYDRRAGTTGRDPVIELIHVSFLENLPSSGEEGAGMLYELGPHLWAGLEAMDGTPPPKRDT